MKKLSVWISLIACAVVPFAGSARASDYVTGYVGWYDLVDQDNQSAQFGIEYRFHPVDFGLRPTLGINATGDGSVYGYGGFNWDVQLVPNQIYLIPNFMAGAYSDGSGKDLGGAIEFRSGIELAYQFPNRERVGIAFNHISNASIYDKNPGAETLLINYSVPVNNLFSY